MKLKDKLSNREFTYNGRIAKAGVLDLYDSIIDNGFFKTK